LRAVYKAVRGIEIDTIGSHAGNGGMFDPLVDDGALREAAHKVADMLGEPSDGLWPNDNDTIRMTHDWPVWMLRELHKALSAPAASAREGE